MNVYKDKIQYDVNLHKIKLRIAVRGDMQNKKLLGDTWSPIASMRTLKYFLEYATKYKDKGSSIIFHCVILASKSL